jgi:energy-converting hydrogenase Eha subunit E
MCLDGSRPRALEHIHLLLVVVGVTRGAIGSGVRDPLPVERMLNGQMARETVDLMIGHV